jgi:hypothetical protein
MAALAVKPCLVSPEIRSHTTFLLIKHMLHHSLLRYDSSLGTPPKDHVMTLG